MRSRASGASLGALLCALCWLTTPAVSQEGEGPTIYRREIFDYQRAARPDPFRSLLQNSDMAVRFEDLKLEGVVYHRDANRSVAILAVTGRDRRLRARVGDRVGQLTVAAIEPRRVDVIIDEFGVPRRESLPLKTEPRDQS